MHSAHSTLYLCTADSAGSTLHLNIAYRADSTLPLGIAYRVDTPDTTYRVYSHDTAYHADSHYAPYTVSNVSSAVAAGYEPFWLGCPGIPETPFDPIRSISLL